MDFRIYSLITAEFRGESERARRSSRKDPNTEVEQLPTMLGLNY